MSALERASRSILPSASWPEAPSALPSNRLVRTLAVRLVVATVVLGGTVALVAVEDFEVASRPLRLLFGLVGATYAFGGWVAWRIRRTRRPRLLLSVQFLWDLLWTSALVYLTGGASSVYSVLYAVTVLLAALTAGARATMAVAAGAVSLYATVALGLAFDWIPPPPWLLTGAGSAPRELLPYALLSNLVGVVLVALFAVALAERLRIAGGELEETAAEARSLARLNEAIVRSTASGLLTADPEGVVQTANPAAEGFFGNPEASLARRTLSELFEAFEDAPPERVERGETRARRPDGETFPVGYTRAPLRGDDGSCIGTLVAFVDLSEVQALREAAARAERLAVLGRLAAGLAHEIRNPLGSISGAVQLVASGASLESEDRRLLEIVRREVARLDDLVRTMLQVSRPRRPERTVFDAVVLVREVLLALRLAPGAERVEIILEGGEAPIEVRADAEQVRRLLWNLVQNAVQASPEGGRVVVRLAGGPAGGLRIEVEDEGAGVPESERGRLFETFYSTREHGVGLGLALVAQVAEAHGGQVWVEEADGGGARFVVTLGGEEAG